jgi:hypothetical protein
MSINVGIVYSTANGTFRRVVVPNTEPPNATAWAQMYCGSGESLALLPKSGNWNYTACAARIKTVTARAVLPSGRCCVVDGGGNVVRLINADPALDSLAGTTLVASDIANIGDHYNVEIANNFSRQYAVVVTATRIVSALSWLALVGATPPDGLHFLVHSPGLKIGDHLPAIPIT